MGASMLNDLHGGQGVVTVHSLMHGRLLAPFSAALWCELEPGASVGRHQQQRDQELVICIGGAGKVEVDGQTAPFVRGVTVLLPLGSSLALENPSSEPLTYIIVKAASM